MYSFCSRKLTTDTLSILFADKKVVERQRLSAAPRYTRYRTIPGTGKWHMFEPSGNIMKMKHTSSSVDEMSYNFTIGEFTTLAAEEMVLGAFYSFQNSSNYQIGMIVDTNPSEGEVLINALKLNRETGKLASPVPFFSSSATTRRFPSNF